MAWCFRHWGTFWMPSVDAILQTGRGKHLRSPHSLSSAQLVWRSHDCRSSFYRPDGNKFHFSAWQHPHEEHARLNRHTPLYHLLCSPARPDVITALWSHLLENVKMCSFLSNHIHCSFRVIKHTDPPRGARLACSIIWRKQSRHAGFMCSCWCDERSQPRVFSPAGRLSSGLLNSLWVFFASVLSFRHHKLIFVEFFHTFTF